jgi:hypothetical protein
MRTLTIWVILELMKTIKQLVNLQQAKRLYKSDLPKPLVLSLIQDLIVENTVEEYIKTQGNPTKAP